jgi:hypothetical protein
LIKHFIEFQYNRMNLVTVTSGEGSPNPAGHRMELFIINRSGVTVTPATAAFDAADPGADMIMTGDFTFASDDDYFRTIPVVVDSAELVNALVGEIGGQAFSNELGFFLASTLKDKLSFASNFVNAYVIVAVKDRNDNLRIIGRHDDPAYLTELSLTQGKTVGDRAGGEYKIACGTGKIAPIFSGTLRIAAVV